MPELVNMKLPPPKEKAAACEPCALTREDYPWGLQLHLADEQLAKLGIEKLPDVGVEVMVVAKAKVTSVNQSANDREKTQHRNVGLQITDLALEAPAQKKQSSDVFYGEKGADEKKA